MSVKSVKSVKSKVRYRDQLDTVKFVMVVLKEHEKELDRSITKLGEVAAQLRKTELVIRKIDNLNKQIDILQREISNLTKCLSYQR